MKARSDAQLRELTEAFRERLAGGESLGKLLPEAFAVLREAAVRTIGERPFDVQVICGAVLHLGRVAEMRTGEGKTLAATLPAYLHALSGTPVHVMTASDYLARRDLEWMSPVYSFLGLTTGLVLAREWQGLEDRRAAYQADITYGTWQQFSYDYLYDNCAYALEDCVQRGHGLAIVDEADLAMIDQAGQLQMISRDAEGPSAWHAELAKVAPRLTRGSDYEVDEQLRTVSLRDAGVSKAEEWLGVSDLYGEASFWLAGWLADALAAKDLYRKDRDYLVADGRLVVIDQLTGRPAPGRVYGNGLQQAIQAREGLAVSAERENLAEIQQHQYLRLYQHLSAMAGVVASESGAYRDLYGLDVVRVPTSRPMIRLDHLDAIFSGTKRKLAAIIDDAAARYATGQPVLIGTVSVAQSETISALLSKRGVPHEVLNARDHQREAEILSAAGRPGAVTVVTQMAGRGVDIRLGGADGAERDRVADLGGLYVLGAERHWQRRFDLHLRGRAGRQGDPGETKFYLSLDDDLLTRILAPKQTARVRRFQKSAGAENKAISWAIGSAQDGMAARATAALQQALEYDAVVADQQRTIYADRRTAMLRKDLAGRVRTMINDVVRDYVHAVHSLADAGLWQNLRELYPVGVTPEGLAAERGCAPVDLDRTFVIDQVSADAQAAYDRREAELGAEVMRDVEVRVILAVTDREWREHVQRLHALRDGIHLRSLAGRSPLAEYRREASKSFDTMRRALPERGIVALFNLEIVIQDNPEPDQ